MPSSDDAAQDPSTLAYDTELVPWLFDHWVSPFLDLAAPTRSSRLIDLACGTGLITRALLGRLGDHGGVEGCDFDPAMIGYARSSVDDRRISWHVADAADLPFDDGCIDGALCHQGLQFFPNRPAALAELHRILRPGGRLTVATWGHIEDNPWPAALEAATRIVLGEESAAGMATVCALAEPTTLTAALSSAGFERATAETQRQMAIHSDVRQAVAGQLAALPSGVVGVDVDARAELAAEMCAKLAPHTDGSGRLAVPSTSVFASARRP